MESARKALKSLLSSQWKSRDIGKTVAEIAEVVGSRVDRKFYDGLQHALTEPWNGLLERKRKQTSQLLGNIEDGLAGKVSCP